MLSTHVLCAVLLCYLPSLLQDVKPFVHGCQPTDLSVGSQETLRDLLLPARDRENVTCATLVDQQILVISMPCPWYACPPSPHAGRRRQCVFPLQGTKAVSNVRRVTCTCTTGILSFPGSAGLYNYTFNTVLNRCSRNVNAERPSAAMI